MVNRHQINDLMQQSQKIISRIAEIQNQFCLTTFFLPKTRKVGYCLTNEYKFDYIQQISNPQTWSVITISVKDGS